MTSITTTNLSINIMNIKILYGFILRWGDFIKGCKSTKKERTTSGLGID